MRRSDLRAWVLALALPLPLLLVACVGRPVRPGLPPELVAAAEARQSAREAIVRLQPDWSLVGRIAVSSDGNGGSGRIEWRQAGPRFEFALSAPVTRQSWRLAGDAGFARLDGLEGGPRQGPDAQQLLLEATGWNIPVLALADWVRGLRAPGPDPALIVYGADARPAQILQGGWQIDYVWPAGVPSGQVDVLPSRVDARQGGARVRLIIDQWSQHGPGE